MLTSATALEPSPASSKQVLQCHHQVPALFPKSSLISNSRFSKAQSLSTRPLEFHTTGATAVLGQPIIHVGAPCHNSKSPGSLGNQL